MRHPTFFLALGLADPRASDASDLLPLGKASQRFQHGGGIGSQCCPLDLLISCID